MSKNIQLHGHVIWVYLTGDDEGSYQRFEVEKAVFRDSSELAIDCNCAAAGDKPFVYTVVLHKQDDLLFRGTWTAGQYADREEGACSCRMYTNGKRLAFVGIWKEGGMTSHWYGEFSPLE